MQTPIFDFVQQYQQGGTARFHMPGHKGCSFLGPEGLDITEIAGADNLQSPEAGGVIAQSEVNATALFGTAATYYSAGGSSACISAMLYLAKLAAPAARKGHILAGRNAHKVFIQACALLDVQPTWLYPAPQDAQGLCSCVITPAALADALVAQQAGDALPMAVYITSPDYLGNLADVAGLAAVCAQYGVPLLVDNAHGAYLKFLQPSQHPIDLGAAICCDSAHKTLPVLTGGAYLQIGQATLSAFFCTHAKAALSLFSSTSPSYLILQSLDLCNAYLAGAYPTALADCIAAADALHARLRVAGYAICESEPLKLVLDCRGVQFLINTPPNDAPCGNTAGEGFPCSQGAHQRFCGGERLADYLRTQGIEPEFADPDFLVCMFTPQNTPQDFATLERALCALVVRACANATYAEGIGTGAVANGAQLPRDITKRSGGCAEDVPRFEPIAPPRQTSHTLRQALFSTGQEIAVENAVGKTCRLATVSCPPAIPIVVGGEVITPADVALFQYYGIETVEIIKE